MSLSHAAPPHVCYYASHATVRLTGLITTEAAFRLGDEIDLLVHYYKYSAIDLHIDSPGGEATALVFLLDRLAEWRRADGLVLGTLALTAAASAAALLLAFGTVGHRRAHRGAMLLYHRPRIVTAGPAVLTQEVLHGYQALLRQANERLLDDLARHVWDGAAAKSGRRRALLVTEDVRDRAPKEVTVGDATALAEMYGRLVGRDHPITPDAAIGMRLIDRIESRA